MRAELRRLLAGAQTFPCSDLVVIDLIATIADQQSMIAGAVEEQHVTTREMSTWIAGVAESVQGSATAAETVRAAATTMSGQAARLRDLLGAQHAG